MSDAVGDPAAVITGPAGPPVLINGQPVLQPCALLTAQDIRTAGGYLTANPTDGLHRRVFDTTTDDLTGVDTGSRYDLPNNGPHCHYTLTIGGGTGSIDLAVHQPTYANPNGIRTATTTLTTGTTPVAIGPVAVHQRRNPNPDTTTWALIHPQALAELVIRHPDPTFTKTIVDLVAARIPTQLANPVGPPRWQYDSPTFTGDHLTACDLLDATVVRQILGVDPIALAEETAAAAVGRIDYGDLLPGGPRNYLRTSCTRHAQGTETTEPTDPRNQTAHSWVQLDATTYEAPAVAQAQLAFLRGYHPDHTTVPVEDADAIHLTPSDGTPEMAIGVGRVVLQISYGIAHRHAIDTAERIRTIGRVLERVIALAQDL
ncbi:MAG TPA: hypothetical protein VGD67_08145 [Pseudonocardiaceae bacterium]